MRMPGHKALFLPLLVILLLSVLPACSSTAQAGGLHLMPMDGLPAQMQSAAVAVRTAYQFAAANPDVLKGIPCYCGCGRIGHTSNYSCYVTGADAQGAITFDNHALGCSLCVNITQDAMRLIQEGRTVPQIKAYVDSTYSKYGTSNMP